METKPIQRTKREQDLIEKYEEAQSAGDREQALLHVRHLIKLRRRNPVYYFWLGDSYRAKGETEKALQNYRRALDYDGKYYVADGDFRELVGGCINATEIEHEAFAAYKAGCYEEAIRHVDRFLELDPREGKAYHLRGICNDCVGAYVSALSDYKAALDCGLPDDARQSIGIRVSWLSKAMAEIKPPGIVKLATTKKARQRIEDKEGQQKLLDYYPQH